MLYFDLFKWGNHIAFMRWFAWELGANNPSPVGPGLFHFLQ
ncbi:hypothetical protein ACFQZF_08290 [Flavobacterium myungsuense]|uniref:Uncharacterized protein n=1 Tax=Flavobacterium myungsuense TaxID=651823 RepID=A0ABW3J426_9FLAO